jgi:hypothetical protein
VSAAALPPDREPTHWRDLTWRESITWAAVLTGATFGLSWFFVWLLFFLAWDADLHPTLAWLAIVTWWASYVHVLIRAGRGDFSKKDEEDADG